MALVDHGAARMISKPDLTATSLVDHPGTDGRPRKPRKMAQSAYELEL